jgi:hypothetical protein
VHDLPSDNSFYCPPLASSASHSNCFSYLVFGPSCNSVILGGLLCKIGFSVKYFFRPKRMSF